MTKSSVGIYVDSEKSNDIYETIRAHFKESIDIVVFSDIASSCKSIQYSTLPSFYMYFFNHPIVFLDTKYIDVMKLKMISQEIYTFNNGEIQAYEI